MLGHHRNCSDVELDVVFRMYRKGMPLKDFLETMNLNPLAKRLFISYCHRGVRGPLKSPVLDPCNSPGRGLLQGTSYSPLPNALSNSSMIVCITLP